MCFGFPSIPQVLSQSSLPEAITTQPSQEENQQHMDLPAIILTSI
jgi:hypothetical protein